MTELAPGKLLVATPLLDDPNFRRAVVLLCAHNEQGSFGLVLNRPLEAPVADLLPEWRDIVSAPSVVFAGGPVDRGQAFALGLSHSLIEEPWWTPVAGDIGLLSLGVEPSDVSRVEDVRLYAGYAGWSSEQLEAEVAGEAWWVADALPRDVFTMQPGRLWHDVLRRQPGQLSLFALFPPDPRLN